VSFAATQNEAAQSATGGDKALAGFLLSGFLLALLGAILPAWGYHRDPPDFVAVGNYFLSLAVGIVAGAVVGRRLVRQRGVRFLLVSACLSSCVSLVYLAMVSPPMPAWWRVAGLVALGAGAGCLNMGIFHALSSSYQGDVAGVVIRGGVCYGLGCLVATLLVAGTFYAYGVPTILLLMAAVPATYAALYARTEFGPPLHRGVPRTRQALADFRSVGAILFALLLFFQFGNEWSLAGWLPLVLIRRVGLSPPAALLTLALYWMFLLTGRLGALAILPSVRHGRLLMVSGLLAVFGCILLFSTDNPFGAGMGVLFVGAGYASVYPLVAEAIGRRFPYYHPGFCNSIFSLALLGGLLAPATLGYAASLWGVGVVIGIPLAGTVTVIVLLLLIWLESKVTGR
jgi:MFS family permease